MMLTKEKIAEDYQLAQVVVGIIADALPEKTTNGVAMMAFGQVIGLLLQDAGEDDRQKMMDMVVNIANRVATKKDYHHVTH
jgi:hypothetical protein